ncbi:MAG: ROK family protein, partial [Eubacteriales bacterium]
KTILAREENLEARDIVMAAQAEDKVALLIIDVAARYLGMGLSNVINLFNPDTIVIGGGVSKAGDILFEPLRREAVKRSLEAPARVVKIVPAELGNDAGCIGAAKLVLLTAD